MHKLTLYSSYKGILFDTSFLIEAVQSPGSLSYLEELFNAHPFYVSETVIRELMHLAEGKSTKSKKAKSALNYIKNREFKTIKSLSENPDEDIILLAKENMFIVATGDREIREVLLKKGMKIIYLKDNYPHLI